VQRDPVTSRLLHIDLYRTQAGEAVRLTVPLVHVGEAPVVEVGGVVLSLLDELEIECLPRDVPEAIHVDLSSLVDMQSVITVADLAIPEGVTVLTDPETDVVRVSLPTKMEEVVEAGAEEVEGAEGPEETEGSESRE
jgi:large subunit ribosomal protein L25